MSSRCAHLDSWAPAEALGEYKATLVRPPNPPAASMTKFWISVLYLKTCSLPLLRSKRIPTHLLGGTMSVALLRLA